MNRIKRCMRKRWYLWLGGPAALVGLGSMLIGTLPDVDRANDVRVELLRQGAYVVECSTPGPNPPPNTGHPCFDAAQRRTAAAVQRVVDTNGNGTPDIQELANALGVPLPLPTTTTTTVLGVD